MSEMRVMLKSTGMEQHCMKYMTFVCSSFMQGARPKAVNHTGRRAEKPPRRLDVDHSVI